MQEMLHFFPLLDYMYCRSSSTYIENVNPIVAYCNNDCLSTSASYSLIHKVGQVIWFISLLEAVEILGIDNSHMCKYCYSS